jgi:tRNA-specific 2-thiouridylase
MSGGVDSSVAALLLQRAGYEVVGATFKLFTNEDVGEEADRPCCSLESVTRARAVCDRLGVPHYTLSFADAFREQVIAPFAAEYAAGRTPNPCVLCNRHLKFDLFLRRALGAEAEFVATGHHARIAAETRSGYRLLPGRDAGKDQSYALCHLNQTTMARVLLPVGELTKGAVRELAREAGLPTAEVTESQDICFVPDGDYVAFLEAQGLAGEPGPILTRDGRVLGEHRGLPGYTVGQRKGLGLSPDGPWFVAEKRVGDNALIVVEAADLRQEVVTLADVNWCDGAAGAWPERWPGGLTVMLRYRARPVACTVVAEEPARHELRLQLAEPLVVAPGQFGVLYDPTDGHVVAGGCIV